MELLVARRTTRALLARGGRLVRDDGYGLIVATHAGFLVAFAAEALVPGRARLHAGTVPLLVLFLAAQALRYWSIGTLGSRWTTRVVVLPDAPLVARGPYRVMRHPNYAAVAVELFALPLAFGLVVTAAGATIVNLVALARRIEAEDRALGRGRGRGATPVS